MELNGKLKKKLILCTLFFVISSSAVFGDADIVDLARRGGGYIEWDFLGNQGTLVLGKHRYRLSLPTGWIVYNYSEKIPGKVYRGEGGGVYVSASAESQILDTVKQIEQQMPSIAAVLIDPGHGGKDPGAIGSHLIDGEEYKVLEKDIVLAVSLDLYKNLKKRYPAKKIMLTRTGDTFPSLEERVEMANSMNLAPHEAIIYISIHANASLNSKAKGFEVWYLPPDYRRTLIDQESIDAESKDVIPILNTMLEEEYTTESILLARRILNGMEEMLGKQTENRGLKEEIWFVVRKAKMPSVLIELGFVTNPEEALALSDPDYLQKLTQSIYNGTVRFIEDFESTRGFTE